ncbi:MAG: DUF4236 domain-containing protein [Pseudonocardia sp.]
MRFRARTTFRFGPLRATVNQAGRWSFAIKIGPITHNLTRRTTSIDTPGPRQGGHAPRVEPLAVGLTS